MKYSNNNTYEIVIPECYSFLLEVHKRKKIISGGRASAKSHSVARALIIESMNHRFRILCCREIQNSIKESVKNLLETIITDSGLAQYFKFFQDRIYCTKTGSEFLFSGLKNMQSKKSLEGIDRAWVEEAQTVSNESWQILVPTIRKKGSEIWATFNRLSEQDPVFVRYCAHPAEDTIYKHFTYRDNPFFNETLESERQLCKIQQPEEYDHVWEGLPLAVDGFKAICPIDLIKKAQATMYQDFEVEDYPRILSIDTARFGDDASNFWLRQGKKAQFLQQLKKADSMQLAGEITRLIDELKIDQCFIDTTGGTGSGAYDRACQLGYGSKITEVNFAKKASGKLYANKRAEMYGLAREWMKDGGSLYSTDENLNAQVRYELSSVYYSYDKNNKILLESKEEVKKRIGKSPDYADGFVLSFAYPVQTKIEQLKNVDQTDYDPYAMD